MQNINFGKTRNLFDVIFHTVILCVILTVVAVIFIISIFTGKFVFQEKAESRISVLKQISDINQNNRLYLENVMNMVYDDLYPELTGMQNENSIRSKLNNIQNTISKIGLNISIDVVLSPQKIYMTENETENSIKSLLNSYWYIKHLSGEMDTSWNLRFLDDNGADRYNLSYGKTVCDNKKNVCGVLIINTSQKSQSREFQQLTREGDKLYILDQNGIVICHSNYQMVGNWLNDINIFKKKYGYNSSKIVWKNRQTYLVSNYYDPESTWIFVEEQNVTGTFQSAFHLLLICIISILLIGAVIIFISYYRVQTALRSLTIFSKNISAVQPEHLKQLPVQTDYREIYVLETVFNELLSQINQLIHDIQKREKEKQKTEYDFLQAQLSPHFMQNTLIAIKSLLSMGKIDGARKMLTEFVEMLYTPTSSEIPFISIREELHLMDDYVSIMNCRSDKNVLFVHDIADHLLDIPIPRMILQPIIGNSFFHGFAEKDENCCIQITAKTQGTSLIMTVTDNGEGIEKHKLDRINNGTSASAGTHHGIGLKNVKKRLKIIYGNNSDLVIESEFNRYTAVTLIINDYDHPLKTETEKMLINDASGIPLEDKDENYCRR